MSLARALDELRTQALAYPETHEDFPWGHSTIKVRTKAFVFLYLDAERTELTLSAKLPQSSEVALLLPFAKPTGYGLGRSGWVTAAFGPQDDLPLDLLRGWLDESYRAVAPAKLSKQLGPTPPRPSKRAPPLPANIPAAKPEAKTRSTAAKTTTPTPSSPTKPRPTTKPKSTTTTKPSPSRPTTASTTKSSKPPKLAAQSKPSGRAKPPATRRSR